MKSTKEKKQLEFIDKKRDVNIIIIHNEYNEKNVFDIKGIKE